jgi:hypothetical protein
VAGRVRRAGQRPQCCAVVEFRRSKQGREAEMLRGGWLELQLQVLGGDWAAARARFAAQSSIPC